jgi:hypothetical protein
LWGAKTSDVDGWEGEVAFQEVVRIIVEDRRNSK